VSSPRRSASTAPRPPSPTAVPTATADGTNGWYKTAVTNTFTASDPGSGLADSTQASFTKSSGTAEGIAVKISSGAVSDLAGNANPGIDSGAFKIDLTAPGAPTFGGIEAKEYSSTTLPARAPSAARRSKPDPGWRTAR
jgi:hypothetical protein